jgi:alkylated DNA repair dioxygenase AlkB
MALADRHLFEPDLPDGFQYRTGVVSAEEEADLAARFSALEFSAFEMRGVVARRRVAFFGWAYDSGGAAPPPIPDFLLPLRERVARWAAVDPAAFAMALVNEYRPGAPIGWHRDAPQYEMVAGVSLLSPCRMKLRPYVSPKDAASGGSRRRATHEITLEPRSGYLMAGEARHHYEHHIPAVGALRYSVTFRTRRV